MESTKTEIDEDEESTEINEWEEFDDSLPETEKEDSPYEDVSIAKGLTEEYKVEAFEKLINRSYEYWLAHHIAGRDVKNQNFVGMFIGGTGSGKSYSALAVAEDFKREDFNIEMVVFTPKDFLDLINSNTIKSTDLVIWDEAGVGVPRREWYAIQNKAISYTLQVFRRDNINLIMTTPNVAFIDKNVMSVMHGIVEMTDPIYVGGKFGYAKYKHIRVRQSDGKIMYRFPNLSDEYGRKIHLSQKMGNMKFELIDNKYLLGQYEKKKLRFTEGLKRDMQKLISGEVDIKLDRPKIIEMFLENPKKWRIIESNYINEEGEPTSMSMADRTSTIISMIDIEFPDKVVKKADLQDALKYVINNNLVDKRNRSSLTPCTEDIACVKKLMTIYGFTPRMVAGHYNCSENTAKSVIKFGREKGWLPKRPRKTKG
ncbi:MAG: hypothetical protein ACTSPB_00540 [Candidatus Thorarchaeota archaeon]